MTEYPLYQEKFPNADWKLIPSHMQEGLCRYIEYGVRQGGFLSSALSNDWDAAARKADHININAFAGYQTFFHNHMPLIARGSEEKFEAWIKHKGFSGIDAAREEGDKS